MENKKVVREYKAPSITTFNKMSLPRRKVIIAKDIIANIQSRKYIANSGAYIKGVKDKEYEELDNDENVRENWEEIKECWVCGIGACLLSITKFKNKLKFNELPGGMENFEDKHLTLLQSVFTPRELTLIEVAFEKYYGNGTNIGRDKLKAEVDRAEISRAIKFGEYKTHIHNPNERMIAIMQRIIDQKGNLQF